MAKRAVLEHTNLETGKKTTYYVHQVFFFAASIYFIASLYFSTFDLTMSILCFLVGAFIIWRAIDVKEEDGKASEN